MVLGRMLRGVIGMVMAVAGLLLTGCQSSEAIGRDARTFSSPEDAVQALTQSLRADDLKQVREIMGSGAQKILSSGDEVADKTGRTKFLSLYDEKHSLSAEKPESRTLVIGNADWPFPIPIVQGDKGWYFDSAAGQEEILNRRIGRNELSAIEVCRAIVDAQQDYALLDPDNDGVHEYAQKFASDPGKKNGLYWPTAEGEKPSPLGPLAVHAAEEGYHRKAQGLTPYHGYYYRILREQGPNAPNGALSYMVKNEMILGFAVVAFPADYGNSGIMTFIVNADGVVYQKDLGDDTAKLAGEMKAYDPDSTWKKVEEGATAAEAK